MGINVPKTNLRSEEGRVSHSNGDAKQAFINRSIGAQFLDLEKHVSWHGGFILDQVVFRRQEEGWVVIFKVHRNGQAYAAFINGATLPETIELAGEFADRGILSWSQDKYPSNRLKKLLKRF